MLEPISDALMILGALLMLLAAVGLVRMPDLFLMMSASTKAATLGVALTMVAALIHFWNMGIAARAVSVIVFILLTAPVSAHMIARAAYFSGVSLWSETKIDELRGRYDEQTHTLVSTPPVQERADQRTSDPN